MTFKPAFTPQMHALVELFKDFGDFKFVGGCVRDLLSEREPKDYDLITPFLPDEVEAFLVKALGKRKVYTVGKRFGTIGFLLNGQVGEITTYRGEDYNGKKCFECNVRTTKAVCPECGGETYATRHPEVTFTTNLHSDLSRRDFTINAMALDPNGKLHDPFKGHEDLDKRIVRAVGVPKVRFKEDPLRILRMVRFAARFGGNIDPATYEKAARCRWELPRVSKERIVSEINAMFKLAPWDIQRALGIMWEMELWQVIMPELQLQHGFDQQNPHHVNELWVHTLLTVRSAAEWWDRAVTLNGVDTPPADASREAHLWAALLHDVAKPFTKRVKMLKDDEGNKYPHPEGHCNYIDHDRLGADIANRFLLYYKFSNDDRKFIVETIETHLKDESWLRPHDNYGKT